MFAGFSLLPIASGDIVSGGVTEDSIGGLGFGCARESFSYDDNEFCFEVDFVADRRDDDRCVWTGEGIDGLVKDDGFIGDWRVGFDGVVAVVQADAENFAWSIDGGGEVRLVS